MFFLLSTLPAPYPTRCFYLFSVFHSCCFLFPSYAIPGLFTIYFFAFILLSVLTSYFSFPFPYLFIALFFLIVASASLCFSSFSSFLIFCCLLLPSCLFLLHSSMSLLTALCLLFIVCLPSIALLFFSFYFSLVSYSIPVVHSCLFFGFAASFCTSASSFFVFLFVSHAAPAFLFLLSFLPYCSLLLSISLFSPSLFFYYWSVPSFILFACRYAAVFSLLLVLFSPFSSFLCLSLISFFNSLFSYCYFPVSQYCSCRSHFPSFVLFLFPPCSCFLLFSPLCPSYCRLYCSSVFFSLFPCYSSLAFRFFYLPYLSGPLRHFRLSSYYLLALLIAFVFLSTFLMLSFAHLFQSSFSQFSLLRLSLPFFFFSACFLLIRST